MFLRFYSAFNRDLEKERSMTLEKLRIRREKHRSETKKGEKCGVFVGQARKVCLRAGPNREGEQVTREMGIRG